ncbi:transcription-silencing protein Clr2-domain-containing protein [Xylogone sp. PMI_703]|nr:transcription-silencing protein Clr2-domain-containing protein [Xylogone sp. PMI_703]
MPAYHPVTVCRSDGQFEVALKNGSGKELNRPTPEQLDKTPDAEGYVDFYEPLGLEDTKAKDWRRKLGGMLMHVLGGKESAGKSYILKEFPEAYVLYEHKKYNQNKVSEDKTKEKGKHAAGVFERQDAYMYGHPQGRKKRYRSPADFFPHVLWLATDEEGDPRNCSCKLCSPDGEQEVEEVPLAVGPDANAKKEIRPTPTPTPVPAPNSNITAPAPSPAPTAAAENKQAIQLPALRPGVSTPDIAGQVPRPKPSALVAASSHRSAEQELDGMANGMYTYRPGELVWFMKGAAWGLGVISKRQILNNKPRYLLQPLSHPLRHPPAQIKEGDNVMRPWLAWTVPSTTHPQIRTVPYDEVPWERVLKGEFGPGDAEVDGSILAAQAINSSYSLFDRIDNPLAVPGEAHYRGMFLGGEKIWVGEPVRLRGIGDEIVVLIIHKLIERTTQSPPTSIVTVVGDIHKLVSMPNPYKDRTEWPVPALPDRMVADLRFRNEVADSAGRRDWLEWRLLEPAARRGLSDIRGRWYESKTLLPIIKPPEFVQQEMARGEMSDTGNLLNTRGDGFAALLKRKKNRKDTFGRAVPDDLKVSRGLDGPESDNVFPDEIGGQMVQ